MSSWEKVMKSFIIFCGIFIFGLATAFANMPQEVKHMSESPLQENIGSKRAVTLYTGSLRDNIARVAHRYGWKKVVWLPKHDYRWVGQTSVKRSSVYTVFSRVLKEYPLQAVFYKGNHVLVITSRNI